MPLACGSFECGKRGRSPYLARLPIITRSAKRFSAMSKVSVVIPALNEEEPIAGVVRECFAAGVPLEVIVVDNGSTDRTADRAREAGARVITAPQGYGRACAAGARAVSVPQSRDDIVVFLDGDGSDVPAFIPQMVEPIARGTHDFVIGSRTRGKREA